MICIQIYNLNFNDFILIFFSFPKKKSIGHKSHFALDILGIYGNKEGKINIA